MHHHERVYLKDAHEVRIPLHAEPLAEEDERHGIEGATHFDVPIGVDGPLLRGEERKRGAGEGLQRGLLDLDEMRPHLAAGRAVNAQARDGAIPVPEKRILRVEAVKLTSLQRIVFDVATAALLFPILLRRARLRRQRREVCKRSCPGEFRAPRHSSGRTRTSHCAPACAASPVVEASPAAGRRAEASTTRTTTAALVAARST